MPLNRLPGFLNLMGTKPKCERGPPDAASLSLSTSKTRQIICLRHSRRAVAGQVEGTSHGHFSRKRIKRRVRRNQRSTETLKSSQPGARAGFRFEARARHSAALRSAFPGGSRLRFLTLPSSSLKGGACRLPGAFVCPLPAGSRWLPNSLTAVVRAGIFC